MDATITDEKPQVAPVVPQAAPQPTVPDDVRTQLATIQGDLHELKAATQTILARLPASLEPPNDEASRKRRALREKYLRPWTPEELAAQQEAMAQLRALMETVYEDTGLTGDELSALYYAVVEAENTP